MSAAKRPAYLYYMDWAEQTLCLPKDLRLRIDDAVKRYVLYGEEPTDKEVLYSMFNLMRTQIDRDSARYRDICKKNHRNAQKRWRRDGNDTTVSERMRPHAVDANNNNDINTDEKRKEKHTKESARSSFVIPSFEDVVGYIAANNLNVDASQFIDYYTSNNWMVGRNKMKDWQAAIRNWARRDKLLPKSIAISPPQKQTDNEARPIYQAL